MQLRDRDHETVVAVRGRELGLSDQEVRDVLELRVRHLTGSGRRLLDVEIEGARRHLLRLGGTPPNDVGA